MNQKKERKEIKKGLYARIMKEADGDDYYFYDVEIGETILWAEDERQALILFAAIEASCCGVGKRI